MAWCQLLLNRRLVIYSLEGPEGTAPMTDLSIYAEPCDPASPRPARAYRKATAIWPRW
jgi:hypothetical protein